MEGNCRRDGNKVTLASSIHADAGTWVPFVSHTRLFPPFRRMYSSPLSFPRVDLKSNASPLGDIWAPVRDEYWPCGSNAISMNLPSGVAEPMTQLAGSSQ